jgi:hypothetical protein
MIDRAALPRWFLQNDDYAKFAGRINTFAKIIGKQMDAQTWINAYTEQQAATRTALADVVQPGEIAVNGFGNRLSGLMPVGETSYGPKIQSSYADISLEHPAQEPCAPQTVDAKEPARGAATGRKYKCQATIRSTAIEADKQR